MEIMDLEFDTLRRIFGFVAESGGENLARAMTVCRVFRELCNDREILKSAVFSSTTISDNLHLFQQFNGVLRKAAQSGSMTAQFLLAKIILMSSTQLLVYPSEIEDDFFDEDQPDTYFRYGSDNEMSDAGTTETEEEDEEEDEKETPASLFLSNFESAKRETPSKSLHHYHYVRMFWANCTPHDLSEMSVALHCYYMYFADSGSYVNSLFSKFIVTAEKLSSFLRGMEELQKYRHGLLDLDNQEVEMLTEASNQEEQEYNVSHDFIIKCRKFGKSLLKLKNERPDDKEFASIIDGQFEEYKVYAETLTSAFEELRANMLPVIDKTFCKSMEVDPCQSTN